MFEKYSKLVWQCLVRFIHSASVGEEIINLRKYLGITLATAKSDDVKLMSHLGYGFFLVNNHSLAFPNSFYSNI